MILRSRLLKRSLLNFRINRMVLDIAVFRPEEGGDPEKIRELQKKRFKVSFARLLSRALISVFR